MDLVSIVVSLAQYKQFEVIIRQSELHYAVVMCHEVFFSFTLENRWMSIVGASVNRDA